MKLLRRKQSVAAPPQWVLGITPSWMDDGEEIIDGVVVRFDKPGWSWTVLREDLSYGYGRIVDVGPAGSREEALAVGLEKLREYQAAYSAEASQ